jgi:hypothetical protein
LGMTAASPERLPSFSGGARVAGERICVDPAR